MPRGWPIPPYQLALIRRLYEANPDISLEEIGRLAGVSRRVLSRWAKRQGWARATRRTAATIDDAVAWTDAACGHAPPEGVAPEDMAATPSVADVSEEGRRALVDGLWLAVTRHVTELRASDGEGRNVQSLMTVVRTVEKLMEMERGSGGQSDYNAPPADEGPADIDEFRHEVARRLEGLLASGAD